MPESTVSVRLRAVTSGFSSAMRTAAGSMTGVQRNADKLTAVGGMLSSTVTPALMAVGGAAAYAGMQFESAMSGVEAVTGAGTEAMADMSSQAQELGRTTQFSATEAAGALEFLGMAGFDAAEATEALPDTLNLAAAGGMELAQSADLASNVLQQFALDVEETGRVADVLAQTATNSNTSVEQLGEAMSMAGPVANAAGLELEETAAAMGAMGDAGIQASRAGTSLRGAMTRLLNPTGPAADVIAELGINAENADGQLRPLPEIIDQLASSGASAGDMMEIFGQRAGPAMAALVEQGGDSLRELTGTIEDSGGAAQEMADTRMDNLSGSLQELRSAAEGAGIALFESGMDDALTGISDAATGILQGAAGLPDWMQSTGLALGGIAAAAGPAISGVGAIANQAPRIAENFRTGRRQISRFASFLTGPWGAAIAGATAAIGLFAAEKARQNRLTQEYISTLDEETGALTENTTAKAASAAQDEGMLEAGRELGLSRGDIVQALLGEKDALDAVNDALDEHMGVVGQQSHGEVGEAAEHLNSVFYDQKDAVADSQAEWREHNEAVAEAEGEYLDVQHAMEGGRTEMEATRRLAQQGAEAFDGAAESSGNLAGETEAAGDAAGEAEEEFSAFTDTLDRLAGTQLDASEAQRAWLDDLESLSSQLDDHGASMDVNTEAGRRNREQIDASIESAFDFGEALVNNGTDADVAAERVSGMVESLREQMIQAGASEEAVDTYLDTLNLTPERIETALEANTEVATGDVRDYLGTLDLTPEQIETFWAAKTEQGTQAALDYLGTLDLTPEEKQTVFDALTAGAIGSAESYKAAIDAIPENKTTTLTTLYTSGRIDHTGHAAAGAAGHTGGWMGAKRYHAGAPIIGSDGSTMPGLASDEVPIIAQTGEFMVNRDASRKHAGLLEAINAGRLHDGGLTAPGPTLPPPVAQPVGGSSGPIEVNTTVELDGMKIGQSHGVYTGLQRQNARRSRRTGGVGL